MTILVARVNELLHLQRTAVKQAVTDVAAAPVRSRDREPARAQDMGPDRSARYRIPSACSPTGAARLTGRITESCGWCIAATPVH
jgi:hypothetical protein